MSTDRKRVEEMKGRTTDRGRNGDRVPKHKQRLADDNQELENKLTEKQSSADTDKAGLSAQQRASVSTAGAQERENVSEFGSDKETERKVKRNQPDVKKE